MRSVVAARRQSERPKSQQRQQHEEEEEGTQSIAAAAAATVSTIYLNRRGDYLERGDVFARAAINGHGNAKVAARAS